jgi:hypothetical protein
VHRQSKLCVALLSQGATCSRTSFISYGNERNHVTPPAKVYAYAHCARTLPPYTKSRLHNSHQNG